MATFKLKVERASVMTTKMFHLFSDGCELEFEVDSDVLLDMIGLEHCVQYFDLDLVEKEDV